jgi:ubiquinone/menaquinone biosynthesis C-methylase UbiE
MNFATFFSNQARKPSGLFGRLFGTLIFRRGNAAINAFVLDCLALRADDQILEIGYGPGELIHAMTRQAVGGAIEGVDFSPPMLTLAAKRNRQAIRAGRVKLHLGDFDALPFDGRRFDRIATVNTVYFWPQPEATIARMAGLLKPGGRVVIGFHAKEDMTASVLSRDVFRLYGTGDLETLLASCGAFKDIRIRSRQGKAQTLYCALGFK